MRLFLFLALTITLFSCSEKKDEILPVERSLTESVYSSIIIQPDSLYQVYAMVTGILDKNMVQEGDLVNEGAILMQIINNTPKLNTQNAKLALDLAKENYNGSADVLRGIEDEIDAAKLKCKNDSINYFRQKNLWDQQIGSRVQYDDQKLNYELASNSLKLLKNRYKRTEKELHTYVKQAQNNYQASLITTKDFAVKSKINGKIYALYKEPGESITTMEPLASIGSARRFNIEMLVDEVDIVRISKGQEAIISLDAYKGKVFNGYVSKIYPQKDERNQTFKVEAIFKERPKLLYPGLSGEANIIIARKKDVLTIPKAYLIDENKVKTENGLISILTGLQNMEYIEVLSGISKDTPIYKPE